MKGDRSTRGYGTKGKRDARRLARRQGAPADVPSLRPIHLVIGRDGNQSVRIHCGSNEQGDTGSTDMNTVTCTACLRTWIDVASTSIVLAAQRLTDLTGTERPS